MHHIRKRPRIVIVDDIGIARQDLEFGDRSKGNASRRDLEILPNTMKRVIIVLSGFITRLGTERKYVYFQAPLRAAAGQLVNELFDSPVGVRKIGLIEMKNSQNRPLPLIEFLLLMSSWPVMPGGLPSTHTY